MAKPLLLRLYWRACAPRRVYVYLLWCVWDAVNRCLEHLPPGHVQVCTLRQMSVDTGMHICAHTFCRLCTLTCTHVCTVFLLALGKEDMCVQLVYEGHLLLAWGVIFWYAKTYGCSSIYSLFGRGVGVYVSWCFTEIQAWAYSHNTF